MIICWLTGYMKKKRRQKEALAKWNNDWDIAYGRWLSTLNALTEAKINKLDTTELHALLRIRGARLEELITMKEHNATC